MVWASILCVFIILTYFIVRMWALDSPAHQFGWGFLFFLLPCKSKFNSQICSGLGVWKNTRGNNNLQNRFSSLYDLDKEESEILVLVICDHSSSSIFMRLNPPFQLCRNSSLSPDIFTLGLTTSFLVKIPLLWFGLYLHLFCFVFNNITFWLYSTVLWVGGEDGLLL